MSASDKKDVLPFLWYRHTGQPEIGGIPVHPPTKRQDEEAIARDVGEYHITHLYINNGVIPHLEVIAPKLTHLQIAGITDPSQLHHLNSLNQLKVLDLSGNDFSNGLPAVIAQLTSLEKLSLHMCQLSDLPQSLNSLNQLKELNLSFNDFSNGLPAAIVQLTSLETLSLVGCKLTDLSQSLDSLKQLKELNLSGNDFSNGLPAVIAQLTSLETLTLIDCKLTDPPQSLYIKKDAVPTIHAQPPVPFTTCSAVPFTSTCSTVTTSSGITATATTTSSLMPICSSPSIPSMSRQVQLCTI